MLSLLLYSRIFQLPKTIVSSVRGTTPPPMQRPCKWCGSMNAFGPLALNDVAPLLRRRAVDMAYRRDVLLIPPGVDAAWQGLWR